jgi:hypothetical protein
MLATLLAARGCSWMIGDTTADIDAGRAAGLGQKEYSRPRGAVSRCAEGRPARPDGTLLGFQHDPAAARDYWHHAPWDFFISDPKRSRICTRGEPKGAF